MEFLGTVTHLNKSLMRLRFTHNGSFHHMVLDRSKDGGKDLAQLYFVQELGSHEPIAPPPNTTVKSGGEDAMCCDKIYLLFWMNDYGVCVDDELVVRIEQYRDQHVYAQDGFKF